MVLVIDFVIICVFSSVFDKLNRLELFALLIKQTITM